VRPEPVLASPGLARLRADGFVVCFDVDPIEADRDRWQDHVENTGIVRMFTEMRTAYTVARLAPDWPRFVRRGGYTSLVREQHVRYDREARMHERFVGGIRVAQRRGKAVVVEQALAEADSGAPVAVAWVIQLLVGPDGRVTDYPDVYWELVERAEGRPIPRVDAGPAGWGPPA
jgi:acyl-CoA thioesterase FadM